MHLLSTIFHVTHPIFYGVQGKDFSAPRTRAEPLVLGFRSTVAQLAYRTADLRVVSSNPGCVVGFGLEHVLLLHVYIINN